MRTVYNTPHEAFCIALFLTNCVMNCQIPTRQNQSVQKRLLPYACLPNLCPSGFQYGNRRHKGNTFILETTLFGWQSLTLMLGLTLLNINILKTTGRLLATGLRDFKKTTAVFQKRIHTFAEPSQLLACRLQANYKS